MTLEESKEIVRKEHDLLQPLREDLLKAHPGKYLLFRYGEVQGVYDTFDDAYRAGLRKYGLDNTFLIDHLDEEQDNNSLVWDFGLRYDAQ